MENETVAIWTPERRGPRRFTACSAMDKLAAFA